KNSRGISTKLVTLSEIYDSFYFSVQGRDNPEKIKYFIKDAKENWGVTYVMLVGNFRKMPIRYTHLETDTGGTYEELEFISDLYYADLYDSEGNFSNWDSDEDGVYGEWPYPAQQTMEDAVDLSPDVYVGRLACMYDFEVKTLVKKIIDYEENAYGSDWFNKMIVVGGDTFDKSWEEGTDYNEGEEANKKALEIMEGFDAVKIWASIGNLTTTNIQNEISKGAGFLYFVGHGNPRNWGTHVNGDYKNWTEGIFNKDMLKFSNDGMYPILLVGGCHNSEFDVTPLNLLKNPKKSWIFSTWVPECWSWFFVKKSSGGAIASIGSIGYGGVNIGDHNSNDIPDCIEGADGWFETQFFRLYNEENIDFLGETYGQTITDYVNNFPVYSDRYDCKIVETHVLFGDPSLKIGGYE
ncbi:MAG: C25 family cysteine peptidase, partial [Candidatus Thermoplasmatota archaeon]|nr:C25 family cysteine peptidase [Candidatus Thermoplasmatota archaeon]